MFHPLFYFYNLQTNCTIPSATPEATATPTAASEEKLPKYHVESVEDISYSNVTRKILNIVVTEDYTLEQLEQIAHNEILDYTKKHKANAIVAGFFTNSNHIGWGYDMGSVEYLPNGKISDAGQVQAGEYTSFEFVNRLTPSQPIRIMR